MNRLTLSFALVSVLAIALPTHADTFSFLISTAPANNDPAANFVASGTLSGPADPFNSNAFDITSITGSANGFSFIGVVDPGSANSQNPVTDFGFTFDDVLYTNGPSVDANGIVLQLGSTVGTSLAHVFFSGVTPQNPGGYEVEVVDPREPGAITPFAIDSFTVTSTAAVPEPSTLLLLGTGVVGLSGLVRRRIAG
jgi:hypothetical protein